MANPPFIQIGGPNVSEIPKEKDTSETAEKLLPEVQSLKQILEKNPELAAKTFENIQKQLALIPSAPENAKIQLSDAQKNFEQGTFEMARLLVNELEKLLTPQTAPDSEIQKHIEIADAYLDNPINPKESVLKKSESMKKEKTLNGTLRDNEARINYTLGNGEKNYPAEYAQEALRGLPIYEEDKETPKIYEAVSPSGGEIRTIYWIPNNPVKRDNDGHWAMKGQMPDHRAFIPDGWTIREIEKPEEKIAAKQEIAQEEPEIQNEKQKIDTAIQNPETRKETAKILAARLTETLRKEMQSAEKSQQGMTEAFLICFNAHFSSISKPTEIKKPEIATKAMPQIIAVGIDEITQKEITAAESKTPEIQEQEGVRYIISTIQEAEQEQQPEEAMEAVITLEEIFESIEITIPQEETASEGKTVSMGDLLAEQKAPPEEESVEIERRITALKTKTIETLQHMRLTFE